MGNFKTTLFNIQNRKIMTEIFITNIQNKVEANRILNSIKTENPELNVNFNFNETEKSYPCGHPILRVEGGKINVNIF